MVYHIYYFYFLFSDGDFRLYKSSIKAAEEILGPTHISMLKLALSMHSMSPRVQAHFQIANEVIAHGDCNTNTFATIGNKVACNLDELKKGLKKVQQQDADDEEEIFSFDHVYPGTENNTLTTVVYGEIGSKEFQEFHDYLKKSIDSRKIKYVSRHFIRVSFFYFQHLFKHSK